MELVPDEVVKDRQTEMQYFEDMRVYKRVPLFLWQISSVLEERLSGPVGSTSTKEI